MKKPIEEKRGYVVGTELFITNKTGTTKVIIESLGLCNQFEWKSLSEIKGELWQVKEHWRGNIWHGCFNDDNYKIKKCHKGEKDV